MNRIIITLTFSFFSIFAFAQFQLKSNGAYSMKYMSVSDPDLYWSQFDDKGNKAILGDNMLLVESKKEEQAISCAEFFFNPAEDDFIAEFLFQPSGVKDDKSFGIVFDYKNEKNFSLVSFTKKGFIYQVCEKGDFSIIRRGMYKLVPRKKKIETAENANLLNAILSNNKVFDVTIIKEQGQLYLLLNDVEIARLKNVKIASPNMGFFVENKMKITAYAVGFTTISHNDDSQE